MWTNVSILYRIFAGFVFLQRRLSLPLYPYTKGSGDNLLPYPLPPHFSLYMPLIEFERTARVNHAWCSIPVQRANGLVYIHRGLVYIHHIISFSKFVFLSLARMHLRYFRWCKIFISFCLSWFLFSLMLCLLLFGSFTTPWNLKTSFLMTWYVLFEITSGK